MTPGWPGRGMGTRPMGRMNVMKSAFGVFKSVLVTGILIVLPAWLAVLLLLKVLVKLGVIVKPIVGQLPEGVNHPLFIAVVIFLLTCLVVGLLFHTTAGRAMGRAVEESVLHRIPGYSPLRSIADQLTEFDREEGFKPALIEVEDGCLTPAFLIDEHEDGRCTVFVQSVPTPLAGSILIMPGERVHPVDVTVPAMMKCVSKWGAGSEEILAAYEAARRNEGLGAAS